jgi:hypothetical protein
VGHEWKPREGQQGEDQIHVSPTRPPRVSTLVFDTRLARGIHVYPTFLPTRKWLFIYNEVDFALEESLTDSTSSCTSTNFPAGLASHTSAGRLYRTSLSVHGVPARPGPARCRKQTRPTSAATYSPIVLFVPDPSSIGMYESPPQVRGSAGIRFPPPKTPSSRAGSGCLRVSLFL